MDTRTPRTPTGGSPGGFFDDEPILSSVKVPSDPAQVIVNNVSFRVKLATPTPQSRALADTAQRLPGVPGGAADPLAPAAVSLPAGAAAAAGAATAVKRRAPVVWSGQSAPGDTAATRLLDAVRPGGLGTVPPQPDGQRPRSAGSTQVLPRVTPDLTVPPSVVGPRPPQDERPLLDGVRPAEGAYDTPAHGTPATDGDGDEGYDAGRYELAGDDRRPAREGADRARHAYYPGRRMNLGVVLLPLRIFLGFISVYAGMGKLTDPVYFEGGERGSMVHWLESLEPWTIAAPLHSFAVAHPVGAGLTVAFLQVLVGVLTVCGLWQRLAAGVGALLSAALLVTVSWRSVPVYDAPDIIYLAAWSPLVIAGAPVYSLDARLTSEAWRRLGPRVALWDLRRRVLRRGALMAAVVAGLTLLVGSLLGSAVRSAQVTTVPEPGEPPRNHLPGSPLPQDPASRPSQGVTSGPTVGPSAGPSAEPSTTPSPDAAEETTGSDGTGDAPSQDQTVQAPAPPPAPEPPAPPPAPEPPTDGSSGGTPDGSTGGTTGGSGDDSGDSTDDSSGRGALGGLLG